MGACQGHGSTERAAEKTIIDDPFFDLDAGMIGMLTDSSANCEEANVLSEGHVHLSSAQLLS